MTGVIFGPEPTACLHGRPWRECKVCGPIIRWVREHPDTDWWTDRPLPMLGFCCDGNVVDGRKQHAPTCPEATV